MIKPEDPIGKEVPLECRSPSATQDMNVAVEK
jgi:hypothetical protein